MINTEFLWKIKFNIFHLAFVLPYIICLIVHLRPGLKILPNMTWGILAGMTIYHMYMIFSKYHIPVNS